MSKLLVRASGLSQGHQNSIYARAVLCGAVGATCVIFSLILLDRDRSTSYSTTIGGKEYTVFTREFFRSSGSAKSEKDWLTFMLILGIINIFIMFLTIVLGSKKGKQFINVYDDHIQAATYLPPSNFDAPYRMIKDISFTPAPLKSRTDSITVITDTQKITIFAVNARQAYHVINNITGLKKYQ